ncbi:MAG: DUF3380 domain-containing protein [Anaerolineales bacterium]|nr:DUF3380 domain-containing protein [Anaerolineales bacterium]
MSNRTGKTKTAVILRDGPGSHHNKSQVLSPMTPVVITGEEGNWFHIRVEHEKGCVRRDYIILDEPETATAALEAAPPAAMAAGISLDAETAHPILVVGGQEEKKTTGKTTAILNFRSGPSTNDSIISVLPLGAVVTILAREGDWFRVSVQGQEGYVHSGFIILNEEGGEGGFIDTEEKEEEPALEDTPLSPIPSEQIKVLTGMSGTEKSLARTWNKFGGLFAVLSNRLNINPGVAVAVFVAEAGGSGFRNGRMVIRFENHIFFNYWGKNNKSVFDQHFRYQETRPWLSHEWRPNTNTPWSSFHGNQDKEWDVFQFAESFSRTSARLSISMGGPQIMGFNYATIGYESVHQMFDAFSKDDAGQITGFFDFVKGPVSDTRRLVALQREDFETFASLYNGPGQAATYASIIRNLFQAFQRIK